LREKTKLSTATLTKHLKELETGIVERRIDHESKEYPPPVLYRIQNPAIAQSAQEYIKRVEKYITVFFPTDNAYPLTVPEMASYLKGFNLEFNLNLLFILSLTYSKDENIEKIKKDTMYAQSLELTLLPLVDTWLSELKKKLDQLEDQGVDVSLLVRDANKYFLKSDTVINDE
jgi:hypothetical protein